MEKKISHPCVHFSSFLLRKEGGSFAFTFFEGPSPRSYSLIGPASFDDGQASTERHMAKGYILAYLCRSL